MKYNYGTYIFGDSIHEIQTELRKYLTGLSMYTKDGKFWLGLESIPILTEETKLSDIKEYLIKMAVYQVEQCQNSIKYMGKTFYGSWNDIYYLFRPYLESLPLKYRVDGYFSVGLLSISIREDLPVKAIKIRLVNNILMRCRDHYKEKYDD